MRLRSVIAVRYEVSPIESLYLSLELDQQRSPVAIEGLARRNLYPAFTDAILLHVSAIILVQANADGVLEHRGHMKACASITRLIRSRLCGSVMPEPWMLASACVEVGS